MWVGLWARRLLLALDLLLEQLAADLELLVLIVHHLPRALPHRRELLAPAQQLELEVAAHLGERRGRGRLQRTGWQTPPGALRAGLSPERDCVGSGIARGVGCVGARCGVGGVEGCGAYALGLLLHLQHGLLGALAVSGALLLPRLGRGALLRGGHLVSVGVGNRVGVRVEVGVRAEVEVRMKVVVEGEAEGRGGGGGTLSRLCSSPTFACPSATRVCSAITSAAWSGFG